MTEAQAVRAEFGSAWARLEAAATNLAPGAAIVFAHWHWETDYPSLGTRPRRPSGHREETAFVLDIWRFERPMSVRRAAPEIQAEPDP